jgi:hypothetical protein
VTGWTGGTFRAFSGDETLWPMAFGGLAAGVRSEKMSELRHAYTFLYVYPFFGIVLHGLRVAKNNYRQGSHRVKRHCHFGTSIAETTTRERGSVGL